MAPVPVADNNGIAICYEVSGNPDGPPLLLVAGLGMHLIDWPAHFVDPLGDDHFVIRYDNRDIGESTELHGEFHDVDALIETIASGAEPTVAYTLSDMASDGVAVLDALGIDKAHVVGLSLGGMIAQVMALEFGDRVSSLTSIMSTTGSPEVGQPSAEALEAILAPTPNGSAAARIDHGVRLGRIWASPEYFNETELRAALERSWQRSGAQAEGRRRQSCAVLVAKPRCEALGSLDMATLVMHGSVDPLIDQSGGRHTAACIPGAELVIIEGMGHDMPPALVDQIIAPLRRHVAAASAD